MAKNRINISIEDSVLKKIDDYARLNGISRSGAICVMANQCINGINGLEALSFIAQEAKKQMLDSLERAED